MAGEELPDSLTDRSLGDQEINISIDTSRGPSEVYVGEKYDYQGGRLTTVPQYENVYKVQQEGWARISRDKGLYDDLSLAYNIFNNKKFNDFVSPDDLRRFYEGFEYDASQRDPKDKVTGIDLIYSSLPAPEVIQEMARSQASGGKYKGPRETITMSSERDLRAAVDAMAAQVLGRAATDEEFQQALSKVRSAEKSEPTITTSTTGRTVTQSGLTAEGRTSIIRETLMQGPEAEDFGKATKMMDLFYSALEARPEGA